MRAVHAYNDKVAACANAAFDEAFHEALRG
jgi:hypothetical protein